MQIKNRVLIDVENSDIVNSGKLGTLTLPSRITSIGKYAFQGCNNLKTLMLTSQLPKLPNDFFSKMASLSSLIILVPAPQWNMIMASLSQDYHSRVVTIDRDNVEHTHRVALSALLKRFI